MDARPFITDLARAAQRLLDILRLSEGGTVHQSVSQKQVALHLLTLEMAILIQRWDRLRLAMDSNGERTCGG